MITFLNCQLQVCYDSIKPMKETFQKYSGQKHIVAALTYLVFFLPRFTNFKGDSEMHFHMKQAIGLLVFALSLQGILSILYYWGGPSVLVWPVRLILLYFLFVGMAGAWKGEKKDLPFIGEYANRAFENIK
jgi:uncharacterized membrane protein